MCRQRTRSDQPSSRVGQLQLNRTSALPSPTVQINTMLATEDQPTPIAWVPDMGSDIDAIGICQLETLGGFVENLGPDHDDVRGVNGDRLHSIGKICPTLSYGDSQCTSTLHVYEGLSDALMSRTTLLALGFLPSDWPHHINRAYVNTPPPSSSTAAEPSAAQISAVRTQLLEEFADVFADSPLQPMNGSPMDILLKPDAVPSCVSGPRVIPYAYRDQVKSQLDEMVATGIIESVSEPSERCHPIVIVAKKGTDEKRLTVDFKKLNDHVRRPTHPTRAPRDAVSNISGAKYFTKLDARHGYWQVPLSDDAKSSPHS